jgi:hypothetical protein
MPIVTQLLDDALGGRLGVTNAVWNTDAVQSACTEKQPWQLSQARVDAAHALRVTELGLGARAVVTGHPSEQWLAKRPHQTLQLAQRQRDQVWVVE